MTGVSPQRARAKRVTRNAIEICGGIEAVVAMEAMRGKSQVSRWHAYNEPDLPTLDCLLGLDAVAVAEGREPPFATFLAHEADRVLIDPPESAPTQAGWLARLGGIAGVTGQLHSEFCAALADGEIGEDERNALRALVVAAQTELSAIDAALDMGGK